MAKLELIPLRKALDHQISRVRKRPDLRDDEAAAAYEAAAQELEMLARKGALTIWGMVDPNGRPAPIPERAWTEVQIDRQSLREEMINAAYRQPKDIHPYPLYYVLAVDKLQFGRLFPPVGWVGKLARTLTGKR